MRARTYPLRPLLFFLYHVCMIRIVTGERGEGKSTLMEKLSSSDPMAFGFISRHRGNGYYLYDVKSGKEELLMSEDLESSFMIGRYHYRQELFDYANLYLSSLECGHIFIDEVGRLEVSGGGFSPALHRIIKENKMDLTISVRSAFLTLVEDCFSIKDAEIIHVSRDTFGVSPL